ncbi:MAG: hypothetical protein LYZ66_01365 [Nitrososphaerales archaeon]|nr:hypothetical protein [Nitrososphaerales archaeon]
MPLKDRRLEYRWGPTKLANVKLMTDRKSYSRSDKIVANLGFKVVGGLREAFHPDVWTVSWEDFDKIIRLTMGASLVMKRGPLAKKLARVKKSVRKASFYWSRDPDLPYRIWAMIIPEDGGPPKIPLNVEDAKSKMLDFTESFKVPASALGPGKHALGASAYVKWGRHSFIEKGDASAKAKPVVVEVE